MAIPSKYLATFLPEKYYQVICKSLNNQVLFLSDENKRYFLSRYKFYLSYFADTYAYNLLDDSVHFIIRIKSFEEIRTHLQTINEENITLIQKNFLADNNTTPIDTLIERQFNSFFVSYTRSFNIYHQRKGHLFDSPFKRLELGDKKQVSQAIVYIHVNAKKGKPINYFTKYPWSSYRSILSNGETLLKRDELLLWFGGREGFIEAHRSWPAYSI